MAFLTSFAWLFRVYTKKNSPCCIQADLTAWSKVNAQIMKIAWSILKFPQQILCYLKTFWSSEIFLAGSFVFMVMATYNHMTPHGSVIATKQL
jgi:hypothetical protein